MDCLPVPPALRDIPGLSVALCRTDGSLPTANELYTTLSTAFPDSSDYLRAMMGKPTTQVRLTALSLLPPLLRAAGYPTEDFTLRRDEHGRPYLAPRIPALSAPDMSLSHSAAHAVCALWCGGRRVGVDVEEPIPPDRAARLSARFCTVDEKALLRIDPQGLSADFTRIWTCKEALAKHTGTGQPLLFDAAQVPPGLRLLSATLPDTGAVLSVCLPTASA